MGDPETADGELKQEVGLFDAVAIEVGLIIGAGLFSITGIAIDIAGTAIFLSYFLSFGIVVLSLIPTAVLGAAYPTTGGNYRYPSRLWSPQIAFFAAWGLAVSMFGGGLPLYALSFGEYVEELFQVEPVVVGLVALTFFYFANLFGIKIAARIQLLLFLTLVGGILIFVVFGLPSVEASNLSPLTPKGIPGLITGAAILYFVCLGANFIVDIGGEMSSATVTIPRSFIISVPLVLALYVLTSFVAVGTVGWKAMAGEPLSVAAENFLPQSLESVFIIGGALFAISTTINGVFMIAPKYLLVLAEDGIFPDAVARVNSRFGTAHWGLTVIYLVSVVSLLSPLPINKLGSLLGFGGIFLIIPVMVSAIIFARDHRDKYRDSPLHIGENKLVGVAAGAIISNTVLFILLATQSTYVFGIWAGLMVVGVVYYFARRFYMSRNGVEISERIDRDELEKM